MTQRPRKVKWVLPKGATQFGALAVILLIDSLVAPHFFSIHIQDGRLFGSIIDILNRGSEIAVLAIGMTRPRCFIGAGNDISHCDGWH